MVADLGSEWPALVLFSGVDFVLFLRVLVDMLFYHNITRLWECPTKTCI